jgi:urea transporter
MSSIATCKFPGVDQFKSLGEKNKVVGFIDSLCSGFSQILLSDNPVTGILIMAAVFVINPPMLLCALVAATAAILFSHLIGIDKFLIHHGFYGFSAAVCGLGVNLFGFSGAAVFPQMLIYSAIAGVISVIAFNAIGTFLSQFGATGLSIPYWVTLAIMIPPLLTSANLSAIPFFAPQLSEVVSAPMVAFDFVSFISSTMIGLALICFQFEVIPGIIMLCALLVSSRIDAAVAVICAAIGTLTAIVIGLPEAGIVIGLYGFNAALVGITLFGRVFRMSLLSAVVTFVMAVFSVFAFEAISLVFLPLGLPVAAMPFGVICVLCMIAGPNFKGLEVIPVAKWGVPETIEKALRAEEAELEKTA